MIDYYLKFKDEAEALEVLAGYTGSIDIIGLVDGCDGWLVNTRGPDSESLLPFSVQVLTPIRVWA